MQSKGWVKLWREQFGHHISKRKPWCDGYAWAYLYSQANYKAGVVNFRSQYVRVERAEFLTSVLSLSKTFGWTRKRTRAFLMALENEGMIDRRSGTTWNQERTTKEYSRRDSRFSIITIRNYEKYQSTEEEKGTAEGTPGEQQKVQQKDNKKKPVEEPPEKHQRDNGGIMGTAEGTPEGTLLKKLRTKERYCRTFETLSAFLSSLPEYPAFPLETRELILEFLNRIRAANKTKTITGGRVCSLLDSLVAIKDRADEESLLVGLKKSFAKEKRDGFDFGKRDPTAYVRSVAGSHKTEGDQKKLEAQAVQEREALRKAEGGKVFQELGDLVK